MLEVLVALSMTLVLLAAVYGVYLAARQGYRLNRGSAQVQQSGRFALALLDDSLRMAGYTGCGGRQVSINNVLSSPSAFSYDFGRGIEGFDAGSGGWSPAEPSALSSLPEPPVPGSDIVTVTTTEGNGQHITADMPNTSADLKVSPVNPPKVSDGEILMISDCSSASVFQVTNYTTSNGNIAHNTGSTYTPGNATKDLGSAFHAGAEVQQITRVSYFVASRSGASDCSAHDCGLYEYEDGQEKELVGGIDNMQLRYGVDSDGDRVPDRYYPASGVSNWKHVVSVRVGLLASSREKALTNGKIGPLQMTLLEQTESVPRDRYLRRVFTGFVALRNRES
ncbi:MAG TPA: PilW family protein [Gammaproteobacteria bacterium]|nr:PilW family protein [Gammaproteobacteria bacterium]